MKNTLGSFLLPLIAAAVVPAVAANPGDLLVTEIMADPNDVNDTAGEYFELYNRTPNPIALSGFVISDNSANHTILAAGNPTIPAFGFFVVGITTNTGTNGGVPVNYAWPTMALGNGGDEITITEGSTTICKATWNDGNDFGPGVAYELKDITTFTGGGLTAHNGPIAAQTNYRAATNNIDGIGADLGSPGAAGTTSFVDWTLLAE